MLLIYSNRTVRNGRLTGKDSCSPLGSAHLNVHKQFPISHATRSGLTCVWCEPLHPTIPVGLAGEAASIETSTCASPTTTSFSKLETPSNMLPA